MIKDREEFRLWILIKEEVILVLIWIGFKLRILKK